MSACKPLSEAHDPAVNGGLPSRLRRRLAAIAALDCVP